MAKKNEIVSAENNITRKDFRGVFWRSFTLLGSFNYERMEGLGFLFSIMPVLRKIFWKIILIVGGVLLCILFVAITVVWSLTDYIFRKLERDV